MDAARCAMSDDADADADPSFAGRAPLPSRAQYSRERAMASLYVRTLSGPLFYVAGTLLTASVGGYLWPPRELAWIPVLAFLVLAVLRWRHRVPSAIESAARADTWLRWHWGLVDAACFIWCGVFIAVCLIERGPSTTVFVGAIATIAFATALCEFACVERWQPSVGIVVLILPAVALFAWRLPALRSVGVAMLIYGLYLLGPQLGRRMRDYEAQMAIEYELLSSRAEMARLARFDALTGLANRLHYQEVVAWLWKQSRRQPVAVSLLVVDLDHFKAINDRFGHDGGDICLKHVAAELRRCFRRETDLVARIGGEEFAVVLPHTTLEAACRLANDFRRALATTPFGVEGASHAVTASIGAASAPDAAATTPAALFASADAACYDAKHNGRNQVVRR